MNLFLTLYNLVGVPLTLGTAVIGVSLVMVVRHTSSFMVSWMREVLRTYYIRDLQDRAFENAIDAKVSYYDQEGSDDILNAIVTQTNYAGETIGRIIKLLEQVFISIMYFIIALVISPTLTLVTAVVFGGFTVLFRYVLESGYDIGERVAEANEERQKVVQATTQGIRDIRGFGLTDQMYSEFQKSVNKFTSARILQRRNSTAINRFYKLAVSICIFILIYSALTFAQLSLGSLSVFLFAMFRLGPRVSSINSLCYEAQNNLPHLVRTLAFVDELSANQEPNDPQQAVPERITRIEFDDVYFSYSADNQILTGINFTVKSGESIAFMGESGAGKSTIASLLTRMYEPDRGTVRANSVPIDEMDISEWRDQISVVRQDPFIFNDTLRYNIAMGNEDMSEVEIEQMCAVSKVDEFLGDLPEGYDTMLGDDGVRLSGGQKQRVALARALLKNADVLVLDEATSDLDSNLERQVQRGIEAMDREYALISIAHRLPTVENADRNYTIEAGRITESGSHQELIERSGKYSELYEIQSSS